jgi:hypothetical protein
MLWDCDSNGTVIANGATGPQGYSCLFGSDYEYTSAISDDVIDSNNYILQDQAGTDDFKVTLGPGRWVVKVIVTVKNTDVAGNHVDSMRVLLDGGNLNSFGNDQARAYNWIASDGTTYTIYQVLAVTDEILTGTKDITVRFQLGEAAGTFIALTRSITAYKSTSFILV